MSPDSVNPSDITVLLSELSAGHTLNTTALVHEAYLNLIKNQEMDWQNRAHFLSMAAIAMRRILIDYARRRLAEKRRNVERRNVERRTSNVERRGRPRELTVVPPTNA